MRLERLHADQAGLVMQLQFAVSESLSDPGLFEVSDMDLVQTMLGGRGFMVGAWEENELAGVLGVYYPGYAHENMGRLLGLPENELDSVAHLEFCCVHPGHMRKAMATHLLRHVLRELPTSRSCAAASASPFNYPSLRNLMHEGLRIRAMAGLYGGKMRYVLHLDRREPVRRSGCGGENVDNTDFARQKKLLAQGWAGVAVEGTAQVFTVRYAPPAGVFKSHSS